MREFVETHVILAPGASEGGLGAAGQVALRADWRDARDARNPVNSSGRQPFVRKHRTWEPYARNWTSYLVTKPNVCPWADQSDLHGNPRLLEWFKGCPNGRRETQSLPKEKQRRSKHTQRRTTNHKPIYTYTKYTQTPDPPPYSGRLLVI